MNRFLKRGLIALIAGVAVTAGGYIMKENGISHYGWPMVLGVLLFGVGFVLTFYSFVRKVEAQGLLEERAEEREKKKKFRIGWKRRKASPLTP